MTQRKTWTARHLPKFRDQLKTLLSATDKPITVRAAAFADDLDQAELYWATAPMSAIAVSAGAQLDEGRWSADEQPAPIGIIVWEEGIGQNSYANLVVPVYGVAWRRVASGIDVLVLTRRDAFMNAVGDAIASRPGRAHEIPINAYSGQSTLPGFLGIGGFRLPDAWTRISKLPADGTSVIAATLAATWALMQQPLIVDNVHADIDSRIRRSYSRAGRPSPVVRLVELRRQYRASGDLPHDDGPSHRHRWVVRGHWRNQPYGRGREQRRKQWIPAHIKGPDGAPMLATELVNIWRR